MERIKANSWIPLFILLLNTFIGIYYLSKAGSFTGEQSIMGIGLILIKTLFRATLWASLIWWICGSQGKENLMAHNLLPPLISGYTSFL